MIILAGARLVTSRRKKGCSVMLSDAELRLLRGTPKEREEEAKRQGIYEVWETKARRDQEQKRRKSHAIVHE